MSGMTSDRCSVTNGGLQGSILNQTLFNVFINGLDAGIKGILSLPVTQNWEELLTPLKALQRDLDK